MSDNESLKILHVAGFEGNIGDNANHNGMRRILTKTINKRIEFENRDIRRYYKNYNHSDQLEFDNNFVKECNTMDLVIFGGGEDFDLWIEDSATGTTIDLTNSQIDSIKTPLVFHGQGFLPKSSVSGELVRKFQTFLDKTLQSRDCLVSVRNDGSIERLRKVIGQSYANQIPVIPDGAFFLETKDYKHKELPESGINIGVNIAADSLKFRFPENSSSTYTDYTNQIATTLDRLLQHHRHNIIFIPHIYSDFKAIADVLSNMDTSYRRNRVTTAQYLYGMGSEKYIFDIYDKVDVSISPRLHGNIPPVGLGTPSIGLTSGHPKVQELYNNIGFPERCVPIHDGNFVYELKDLIDTSLDNSDKIAEKYQSRVNELESNLKSFHADINSIL